MNICYITEEWPGENDYGGIGFHFQNLATYFTSHKHHVTIIYSGTVSKLLNSSYRVIGTKIFLRQSPINFLFYNPFVKLIVQMMRSIFPELTRITIWNFEAVLTFILLTNTRSFDLTETHDYHSTPILLILSWFTHPVVTIQGWKKLTLDLNLEKINLEKKLMDLCEKYFLRHIHNCYANSHNTMYKAASCLNIKVKTYIYNAIDTDFFTPGNIHKNYILFAGRYEQRKGVLLLIQAYQDMCDVIGIANAPYLYMIGGDSHLFYINGRYLKFSDFINMYINENIRKRILLIPYQNRINLRRYYQQSTFCVFPSTFEPFGNTIAEALSCGKAIITTNKGGAAEQLHNLKDAIIITPTSTALKKAMLKMLCNDDIKNKLEINARLVAIKLFSINKVGKQTLDYYHEIIHEKTKNENLRSYSNKPQC